MHISKTPDGGISLELTPQETQQLVNILKAAASSNINLSKDLFTDVPDVIEPPKPLTEDVIFKGFHVKSRAFFSELRHTYGSGVWIDSADAKFQEIRHKHAVYNFYSSAEILADRKALDVRHEPHKRQWFIKYLW